MCLWEDEWATHLLQFDYIRPWLNCLQLQFLHHLYSILEPFELTQLPLRLDLVRVDIRVPMAVAIFNGTGAAKYRGTPKDEQSQQSLSIWGWCRIEGDELH